MASKRVGSSAGQGLGEIFGEIDLHLDRAAESRAVVDDDAWSPDVALDASALVNRDRAGRRDVPDDLTANLDAVDVEVGLDDARFRDGQVTGERDRALDPAFDDQILFANEGATDEDLVADDAGSVRLSGKCHESLGTRESGRRRLPLRPHWVKTIGGLLGPCRSRAI